MPDVPSQSAPQSANPSPAGPLPTATATVGSPAGPALAQTLPPSVVVEPGTSGATPIKPPVEPPVVRLPPMPVGLAPSAKPPVAAAAPAPAKVANIEQTDPMLAGLPIASTPETRGGPFGRVRCGKCGLEFLTTRPNLRCPKCEGSPTGESLEKAFPTVK